MVLPESGPPGLSIVTMLSAPAIYKTVRGRYKWLAGLVSRVYMAGLDSRVRVCPRRTKYDAVDSPGVPQFWGDH